MKYLRHQRPASTRSGQAVSNLMATISRCDSGDFTAHFRSAGSLGRIVALPVTSLLVLDFTDTAFTRHTGELAGIKSCYQELASRECLCKNPGHANAWLVRFNAADREPP